MEESETADSNANAISPDFVLVMFKLQYLMIAISSAIFLALLGLIWREKTIGKLSWRQIINPINTLLAVICLFQIILHMSIVLKCWESCHSVVYGVVTFLVEDIAIYVIVQCYMQFAWMRGYEVLRKMFPKYINYFQWFVRLSPVVFVLTVIVDAVVISMNLEGNTFSTVYMYLNVIDIVLTALSGWTAVIFDTTVFFAFVYYLRKISADADISLDKRLKIIAQFGAVTSLLGMVIFVFNVLGVLFPLHTIPHIILYHVAMLFLDIVVLLLVVMKHHLITEKEKQTSNIILSGSPDKSASKEEQESDSEMGLWRYLVSRIFGIRSSRKDSTIRTSTRKPESRVLSRTTTTSKFGSNNGVEAS